jgi:hypothetical protein
MRGTCHYTHLLLVEVESCELSAWISLELLISASQLSRITGVSHYTRLVLFFKHLHIMLVHFFVLRTLSRSLSFSAPVSLSPDCGSLTPFQKEMRMHNTYMDKGLWQIVGYASSVGCHRTHDCHFPIGVFLPMCYSGPHLAGDFIVDPPASLVSLLFAHRARIPHLWAGNYSSGLTGSYLLEWQGLSRNNLRLSFCCKSSPNLLFGS